MISSSGSRLAKDFALLGAESEGRRRQQRQHKLEPSGEVLAKCARHPATLQNIVGTYIYCGTSAISGAKNILCVLGSVRYAQHSRRVATFLSFVKAPSDLSGSVPSLEGVRLACTIGCHSLSKDVMASRGGPGAPGLAGVLGLEEGAAVSDDPAEVRVHRVEVDVEEDGRRLADDRQLDHLLLFVPF